MPQRIPKGMVFVSYASADFKRVKPLVNILAKRFNVWWDRKTDPGEAWRRTIMEKLRLARCVVVLWTANSVDRDWVWSEVDRAKDRGILVPVKLERSAEIPPPFDQFQNVDLTSWTGRTTRDLKVLLDRVKRLLTRPSRETRQSSGLTSDNWVVDQSLQASQNLLRLSNEIRSIKGVLVPGAAKPTRDLLGTLEEIHRTYESVSAAISRFVAPAVKSGQIKATPYLAMERGELITTIENNRGHCTRIVEYYGRVGGLRDWLMPRLPANKLKALDGVFAQLAHADVDLFEALTRIGDTLTEEASDIVGLLLSGQQEVARSRILEGRKKLLPLQRDLSQAMRKLQQIESSVGYVPRAARM